MSEPTNNEPVASKQFDRVHAAIWSQNGEDRTRYTTTLHRSYRDANNQWQRSYSFDARDLPHLKLAIDWAMHQVLLRED